MKVYKGMSQDVQPFLNSSSLLLIVLKWMALICPYAGDARNHFSVQLYGKNVPVNTVTELNGTVARA